MSFPEFCFNSMNQLVCINFTMPNLYKNEDIRKDSFIALKTLDYEKLKKINWN